MKTPRDKLAPVLAGALLFYMVMPPLNELSLLFGLIGVWLTYRHWTALS